MSLTDGEVCSIRFKIAATDGYGREAMMLDIFREKFHPRKIIENPSEDILRESALETGGILSEFGTLAVTTRVRNRDEFWGYDVPVEIQGLDMSRFDLNNYYSEERIQALRQALKKERLSWLSQFEGLGRDIICALKP